MRSPTRRSLAQKILSCVARVKQTWGIGARHRRPDRTGDREGRGRRSRRSVDVRAAEGRAGGGHPRLHRAAGRRRPPDARRRSVSGAAADGGRRGAAPRRRRLLPCIARFSRRQDEARDGERDGLDAGADGGLFDVLREVRLRLARERGVPPYVIFHDTTLRDMVRAPAADARGSARHLRRRREEGGRFRRRVSRRHSNLRTT